MQYLILFFCLFSQLSFAQNDKVHVYLIPGQGSDYRLYKNITLDDPFQMHYVHHQEPAEGSSLQEYAALLFQQVDTSQAFILVGVSLGGMLAVEMNEWCDPLKTVVISSAKTRNELPFRYRFQRYLPIYKNVPGEISKQGALLLQPIVEPDRDQAKEVFVSMLQSKSPTFYERTIAMIMEWDRTTSPEGIIHIHGENDHTIPIRNVAFDHALETGSHMMTLTEGEKITALLHKIFKEN